MPIIQLAYATTYNLSLLRATKIILESTNILVSIKAFSQLPMINLTVIQMMQECLNFSTILLYKSNFM